MDFTALLSAVFFFAANVTVLAFFGKEFRRIHFDENLKRELDPDYIQEEWAFRRDHRGLFLTAGVLNAFAWFFFCFPMVQLAWILSRRGTKSVGLHVGIAFLAILGSFTEFLGRFMYIGSSIATSLLTSDFNLSNWISANSNDQIGWRNVELVHEVTAGTQALVDACEWFILFFLMIMVHISVRRWRAVDNTTFGACWNVMGLFIGLLALLDFVAEVLRLDSFRLFGPVTFFYGTINRLILFPIWLVLLAFRLPYAALKLNEAQYGAQDLQ